ncbi:MAG: hypothetical protein H7124_02250 [Phycisphaerales bacterium]|nr:hypothetical protein [Hyphomonadaceae bacterium]
MPQPRRPALASDDWMLEQQVRAELEAEAWRRLRCEVAAPAIEAPANDAASIDYHRSGNGLLKALVRFALGSFGAYLAWIAALDSQLGEFEVWLAISAGFILTLALSLVGPARGFVHLLAETARWGIIVGAAFGGLWLLLQGYA